MGKHNKKYDEGFVRILEDSRGIKFNSLGFIRKGKLRILSELSEDRISMGYISTNPDKYKFVYLDLDLFDVMVSLDEYIGDLNLEASKFHLDNSEGQQQACKSISKEYLNLLYDKFNSGYINSKNDYYSLDEKYKIKDNFDWFLNKLKEDGYNISVEYDAFGDYRMGVFNRDSGLFGSFCEYHSKEESYYSGYYNNGKIAVDNEKSFSKLSICPICIRIPQDDNEYEYLKYYLDLLKSDYGYSLSSDFDFTEVRDYN